ncbi:MULTISPECIES: MlaD family protein [unclassified Fibrobacter]|uniref:MlaD family protein n=1 Tax=unclassified Fibrobacter TaxID=2634177 RepID=UPI000D6C5809|nr:MULTISPECIES: MlaD family protein [unclassified Fibrobacter]PWJ70044.1 phospholipid/cholesterol/gamma-HCH transport system substrate-binding protein [Fibrobacter sp. UWR4]PZW73392.1 phospholipid/cholesterol/gamma-HCH transport system substrate-binding protein [Fibrobacter sp. UWR1]
MNRFIRLVKENVIPSIVFAILVVSCVGAWYFFHPSSPYHPRYSFVVSYQAIGTLSPGNPVEVRGIKAGEITKVELTEDAVYVTARVYSTVKIPVNSEFRLINSGLMGEREMCILSGDSEKLIADGDTLFGKYDEGTSGVFKSLSEAFDNLTDIRDTLKALIEAVTEGDAGKQIQRVISKGQKIVRMTKQDVKSWMGDAEKLLGDLDHSLSEAKGIMDNAVGKGGPKVEQLGSYVDRLDALLTRVKNASEQVHGLLGKFAEKNTVGLVLQPGGALSKELDAILKDTEALFDDIRKNSLKLNVDIF